MTIILYKVPNIINVNNNNVLATNYAGSRLGVHIQSFPKLIIGVDYTPKWIKNIHSLENRITLYNNNREPLHEYNYMEVRRDNMDHFFFITAYQELGASQVAYTLRKDTLNTYCSNLYAPKVDITDSYGLVLREHKDRFDSSNKPIYDRTIEELNVTPIILSELLHRTTQRTQLALRQFGGETVGTQVMSNPKYVWEIFTKNSVVFQKSTDVSYEIQLTLGWGFTTTGKVEIIVDGVTTTIPASYATNDSTFFRNSDGRLGLMNLTSNWIANSILGSNVVVNGATILFANTQDSYTVNIKISNYNTFEIFYNTGFTLPIVATSTGDRFATRVLFLSVTKNPALDLTFSRTRAIDELNKSDRKIVKIIELPYRPKVEMLFKVGSASQNPTVKGVYFEILKDIELDFQKTLSLNLPTYQHSPNNLQSRFLLNDPKIYTSQFMPRFVTFYNEAIPIGLEKVIHTTVRLEHKLSTGDYSKLRILLNESDYLQDKPYESVRNIDMNNEVVIFKNDIQDYIETLYSNDLKLMQLQEAQANRNIAKASANVITSTAAGAATGMMVGNFAGAAVGAITGAVKGIINIGFAAGDAQAAKRQREIEFESKLLTLQNSLINLAGSSPEMHHTNNSDAIKLYKLSPTAAELAYLDDYFHRFGYQTLELKKVQLQTRFFFDHKQILFEKLHSIVNLPLEVELDIRQRFAQGVTFFYHTYAISGGGWDLEQKYENKEI